MKYQPLTERDEPNFVSRIEANQAQIQVIDEEARLNDQLLYRFLYEQYADGYAVYQIIRVNKTSCRVRVCVEIGDDWEIPYWGQETTIPLDYARESISRRDYFNARFAARASS